MSNINTSTIQANYPIAGINNSTQGFRDNFNNIKLNLDITSTEITELQSKSILKSALSDTLLDNNLDNTLLSNALIKGFREVTNNLGSNLSESVIIDVSKAPIHHGTIIDNVAISFVKWAPVGTHCTVELQFTVSNPLATITFPSNVNLTSFLKLENATNTYSVTVPANTTQVNYILSTIDCGLTIDIQQVYNSPRTSQIQQRTPSAVGFQGDQKGSTCMDDQYLYIAKAPYDATIDSKAVSNTFATTNLVKLSDTTNVAANIPIIFTGTTFGGIVANYPYYVKTVNSGNATITISSTRSGGTAGTTFALTDASGTMTGTVYIGTSIWTRIPLTTF